MSGVSYDPFHDPHLAAYYSKPSVEKQVMRSAIAARLEKRPVHFREFAAYLTKSVSPICCDLASSSCSCSEHEQTSCQFCQLKNGRTKLLRRYESLGETFTPSPLGRFLQQLRARRDVSQAADDGVLRSSSACGLRPTPPASRSESRSSSRQSRPSSRPSSASGNRPPSRNVETLRNTPQVIRKTLQEHAPSPAPDRAASTRPDKQHCKKVRFDEGRSEAAAATVHAVVPKIGLRGRRLVVNPKTASNSAPHVISSSEVFCDPCALSTGECRMSSHDDEAMRMMVSSISQSAPQCSTREQNASNCQPQTFVLIKFTMHQYRGATTLQRWFRGTLARMMVKRMQRAAMKIQRTFRRFRSTCRTAVAVWMLEKDRQGYWHPRSTFDQVSQCPSSARVHFASRGAVDSTIPGSLRGLHVPLVPESLRSTIDFHKGTIASLGHVMSLLVSEPQERMNIVYDEVSAAREIGALECSNAELVRRRAIVTAELEEWNVIELHRSYLMRLLQGKRKLLLHQDVGRQQLTKNEGDSIAAILGLQQAYRDVLAESAARVKLVAQWNDSRAASTIDFVHHLETMLRCALELDAIDAVEEVLRLKCEMDCITESLWLLQMQEGAMRRCLLSSESCAVTSLHDPLEVMQEIRRTVSTVIDQAVADFEGSA